MKAASKNKPRARRRSAASPRRARRDKTAVEARVSEHDQRLAAAEQAPEAMFRAHPTADEPAWPGPNDLIDQFEFRHLQD